MLSRDPGTTLWLLSKEEQSASCVARLMPYGIEIDLLRNGHLVVTRVFDTDDEALAWARDKRHDRERDGWVEPN